MNWKSLFVFIVFGISLIGCKTENENSLESEVDYIPQNIKLEPEERVAVGTLNSPKKQDKEEEAKPIRIVSAEQATIEIFKEAAPSVCFINTSNLKTDYYGRNVYEQPAGSGSGFIWDKSGHIVTNYHVIKGASKATVTLSNHKAYEARLIGVEPDKDLAVLKIDAPRNILTPLARGTSNDLLVGQHV